MWSIVAQQASNALLSMGQAKANVALAKQQSKTAMLKLGEGLNQLNLQRAQTRQQTAQALFNSKVQAEQARSQVSLQAAASDTIGASVQDAVSTVNVIESRQEAGIRRSQMNQEEAFRLQANTMIDSAADSVQWPTAGHSYVSSMLGATAPILGTMAGDYLSGLGQTDSEVKTAPEFKVQDYGYDLWGNKGTEKVTASWKDYLG
jgi:hypothetical protein